MTGYAGQVTSDKTQVYMSPASYSYPSSPSYTEFVGASKLVIAANLLPKVGEIGDLTENTATISFINFGEDTEQTIPGISTQDTWSLTLNLDRSNAQHIRLADAAKGTKFTFALHTLTGSNGTVDVLQVTKSGSSKPYATGSQYQMAIEFTLDAPYVTYDKT